MDHMEMKKSFLEQTAILVFANSPEEEMRQKSLIKAGDLYKEFTNRTIDTVRKTGITYFHFSEKEQVGLNFGERFVNAIQEVYNLGYDYIITIGNDTPELKARHIHEAVTHLFAGKTVLGPSADGGFYLLGLEKSKFSALEFKELPWQTSSLRSSVLLIMRKKNVDVYGLQTFIDIDNVNDIRLLIQRTKYILFGIKKYLRFILDASLPSECMPHGQVKSAFLHLFYNKGSPDL